ncbi:MAG: hypothetical protein Q9209_005272 [Squamulea sp. 1 TL-2023]
MPGVPSSRGCDSCRKQKKKVTPSASTSQILKIDCVGHGQQRYKFKNKTLDVAIAHQTAVKVQSESQQQVVVVQPTRDLSNRLSSLTSNFIHRISQDVDIRYQLPWNFGIFLSGVPRRLGRSAALDAAADALVTAHTNYSAGNVAPNQVALTKYSRALSVLCHDLDDKAKASSAESLGAVMVLSVAQLFVDPCRDQPISHIQGAAQIMKSRGFGRCSDDFERSLIMTLRGPVVFDALLTDKIHLTSHDWKLLNGDKSETKIPDAQWFHCIAVIPDLIHRCKAALIMYDAPCMHLLALELETRSLLDDCRGVFTPLRQRLADYDPSAHPAKLRNHLHAHYLRTLALALGTGIIINCVLSGLEGTSDWVSEDSSLWSAEIIDLAQRATKYRPLGSMAMLICLRMAWMGAASTSARTEIEAMLLEYSMACIGAPEKDSGPASLEQTFRRFTLQDL